VCPSLRSWTKTTTPYYTINYRIPPLSEVLRLHEVVAEAIYVPDIDEVWVATVSGLLITRYYNLAR
jgi:hypothetical protein